MAARQPNLIDRAVGYFSPVRGLRRQVARDLLTRAYEGASRNDGWAPRRAGASANTDIAADGRELRVRSRALMQNVPYVAHGMRAHTANVISTGIMPTWTGVNADKLNTAFRRWCDECDADGRLGYAAMQSAAHLAAGVDGDAFIRLRMRHKSDGLQVPLQLQLLEADYLDSEKIADLPNGGRIVNGIETDAIGRIVGYWMFRNHPGDGYSLRTTPSYRVDAADIIHFFNPERPGQGRGIPRLAPVIARVRDLQLYEDAELNRKNLETRLAVLASGDIELLSQGASEGGYNVKGTESLGALPSGGVLQVPVGSSMTVVEPKAMPGHVDYVKHQQHIIAAGIGVTYEMMTGDVSEVSYTSARVRMLDYRRDAEAEQWNLVVPKLCNPIVRAFENAAVLGQVINRASYEFDHSTPKWQQVDPSKDVAADLAEIGGGFCSISEKIRQRGFTPAEVFAELADDVNTLKSLGLFEALAIMRSKSGAQGLAALQDDEPAPAKKKAKG